VRERKKELLCRQAGRRAIVDNGASFVAVRGGRGELASCRRCNRSPLGSSLGVLGGTDIN